MFVNDSFHAVHGNSSEYESFSYRYNKTAKVKIIPPFNRFLWHSYWNPPKQTSILHHFTWYGDNVLLPSRQHWWPYRDTAPFEYRTTESNKTSHSIIKQSKQAWFYQHPVAFKWHRKFRFWIEIKLSQMTCSICAVCYVCVCWVQFYNFVASSLVIARHNFESTPALECINQAAGRACFVLRWTVNRSCTIAPFLLQSSTSTLTGCRGWW